MEKHSYFCLADDGQILTGFVVLAYSREQIENIFCSPNTKWVTVFESGFEEHEVYKTRVKPYLDKLTFDVDSPTGPLEYYMRKNGIVPQQGAAENGIAALEKASSKNRKTNAPS